MQYYEHILRENLTHPRGRNTDKNGGKNSKKAKYPLLDLLAKQMRVQTANTLSRPSHPSYPENLENFLRLSYTYLSQIL